MGGTDTRRLVGLDLGGTAIKAGCIDADGRVLAERGARPPFELGPEAVLDTLAELARELGAGAGGGGIGLGVPGLIDRGRGYVHQSPNLPGFRELDARAGLARRLELDPLDVRVENDANAAALGERWLGVARGERNVLVLTLGTGIGGGLILDDRLIVGEGMGGEPGHVIIDPGGLECACGRRGCTETLASARAASRRAREAGLPAEAPGDLELLAARAREGHAPEAALLREVGRDLGRMLGVVVSLLDLRTFVFGGGFSAALDTLEAGIHEGLVERTYGGRAGRIRLLRAGLGPSAGWIGAAWALL